MNILVNEKTEIINLEHVVHTLLHHYNHHLEHETVVFYMTPMNGEATRTGEVGAEGDPFCEFGPYRIEVTDVEECAALRSFLRSQAVDLATLAVKELEVVGE